MKQSKIEEFEKALQLFKLEIVDMTGRSGYEERKGKVLAIRKINELGFRVCCIYSTYDQLFEWAKNRLVD